MRLKFRIDLWLLAPVVILVTVSLTTLASIDVSYFQSQAVALVVGLVAFFFFSQINIDAVKQFRNSIYIISIILLGIVLLMGIESRGAVRWVEILGVRIQFSEVLKPFLALSYASFIADNRHPSLKSFFSILFLTLPIVLLIVWQPDLGSGLIYAFVALLTLLVSGFPFRWFVIVLIPFILASPLIMSQLHEYQRQRILTFLNPTADPLGTSYNSIQAIIAVGSGSFFGKGLSEGTQSGLKFLPEKHTDFIFATIAEGLGFVGVVIIIAALFLLCYRSYIIFKNANDFFTKIFTASCFGFLFVPFFINIAMNIGYLPIVGVTLPFVSYGGSSLLSSFIFLGFLSAVSVGQRKKDILQIK